MYMTHHELILSRLNTINRQIQELSQMIKHDDPNRYKPHRSNRIYQSNADKQRAYRQRKKGTGTT
jgi:hypothetical protein